MRPPCEVMVVQLLPAFRALISHHLMKDYNFTQSQVAEALGVTQASISRSRTQLKRFEKHYTPGVRRAAKTIAEQLSRGELSLEEGIGVLCDFCRSQRIGGILCRLHRDENPELATCNICGEGVIPKFRIGVLNSLIRGTQLLQASSEFTAIIPQVQSQLVMSVPDAHDVDDVAGFPSRIGTLDKRAHAFTGPEFGASTHLSQILLLIQKWKPTQRAAIVLKYQPDMEKTLQKLKLSYIQVIRKTVQGRRDTDEALIAAIRDVLSEKESVDVLIDKGLVGIEAVAYLFAEDAEQAASKAISLAKQLAG
jgi:predicted fused transcriptional regulator/phosphomethylpyrimidine kinase/predicted transcriptional regulator